MLDISAYYCSSWNNLAQQKEALEKLPLPDSFPSNCSIAFRRQGEEEEGGQEGMEEKKHYFTPNACWLMSNSSS